MNLNLLIQLRKNMGIRQDEMAEKLQITTKTYNFKENGKYEFKISELLLLCNALGVSESDFVRILFGHNFPNVNNLNITEEKR